MTDPQLSNAIATAERSTRDDSTLRCGMADRSGAFTNYKRVGIKWGFRSAEERDLVMDRQIKAHEQGIGPAVYGVCKMNNLYGYVTEIAGMYHPASNAVAAADMDELQDALDELFPDQHGRFDLGTDNMGVVDGNVVCIDFGFNR